MPIFRVKSVKIYTGQKNLHGYTRGSHDKYEVWYFLISLALLSKIDYNIAGGFQIVC